MLCKIVFFFSAIFILSQSNVRAFVSVSEDSLFRFKQERRIPMSPAQTLRLKGHEFGDRIEPIEYHLAMNERVVPPPPPPKPLNVPIIVSNSASMNENPLPPPPPPVPTANSSPRNRDVPMPTRMSYEEEVRNNLNDKPPTNENVSNNRNNFNSGPNQRRNPNNQPKLITDGPVNSIDWNDDREDKKKRVVVGYEVVDNDDMNSGRPDAKGTEYYKVLHSPEVLVPVTTPMTRYVDDNEDVYHGQASTARMKDCLLNDMDKIWESRTKKASQAFVPRNELEATCKPFIEKIEDLREQCMDALEVLMMSTAKKRQDSSNRKSWWKFLPFGKK